MVGAALLTATTGSLHWSDAADVGTGKGVAAVVVALGGLAALLAVGGTVREPGLWLLAVGTALVLAGSGVLRWSEAETIRTAGRGDIVVSADIVWPLMGPGVALAGAGIVWLRLRRLGIRPLAAMAGLSVELMGLVIVATTMGNVVVGQWVEGRPRRHRGRLVRTAPTTTGGVGEVWAGAARDEAAAVEAFTALADRLERVDAPADLVRRSRAAAADEVRHARQCRRLAIELGGESAPPGADIPPSSPGASRSGAVEIVRLAVESYVDGVVGEAMAAARLELGAATAPGLAPTLRSIAEDERAHAALGADIVRWCATQRPALVRLAVRAAGRRLPATTVLPPAHARHADPVLRAAGLVDREGSAMVWKAERDAARRVLDHLVPGPAPV